MYNISNSNYLSFPDKNIGLTTIENWDKHNREVLKGDIIGKTDENTSITKNCIVKVNQTSSNNYDDTTDQLKFRARHINYWKSEIERAIQDINVEIDVLEEQRQQLKNAMDILNIPQQITEECLNLRLNRMQSDLVYDEPQDQLFKESVLIQNIKKLQQELLRDIERQLQMNVSAKEGLEKDWGNKYLAFQYENHNSNLKSKAFNVKDTAGATRLSEGQSDVQSWEQHTISALEIFNNALEKSKALRDRVEAVLINSSRDLRSQDIRVNKALNERIACIERIKINLESQLHLTLEKIAESENILRTLHEEILKISQRIQVAQTRLNIKNCRPHIENCREGSLIGLIDEIRDLNESMSLLRKRCIQTENLRAELIHERSKIENEIIVKKKSLHVDNERCLFLRSHFQSAEKLCGF